jgi:hypothetical protein
MAKSVYRYGFSPQVYEYDDATGIIRPITSMQELASMGYTTADIQTQQGELIKKPGDPTVYEYHSEDQSLHAIPTMEALTAAGYQASDIREIPEEALTAIIAADAAIMDENTIGRDFEEWWASQEPAYLEALQAESAQYLRTEEERATREYEQSQRYLTEDQQTYEREFGTARTQAMQDRLDALKQYEFEKGKTIRGWNESIGQRGIARSGIRLREEKEIKTALGTQKQDIEQGYERRIGSLAEQRQQALTNFNRQRSGYETGYGDTLADIAKARETFFEQTRDAYKQGAMNTFETQRNTRSLYTNPTQYLRG